MSDSPARLLRLLSLLQTRRSWSGAELGSRLEVSPRTIRRDVERLRDLGYPVHASRGALGGYRLQAGTAMPPLLLDDDEAVAVAIGLRAAAAGTIEGIEEASVRALNKLEQVLPARPRRRVAALEQATIALAAGGPTVAPETLAVIAAAVTGHERLRFTYRAKDERRTRRLVEPHRLVAAGRRWYLVAYDNTREDWRTFRVDRITSPAATGVRAPSRKLPAQDAAAYVAQSLAAGIARHRAVVIVHAPLATVADRLGAGEAVLEPLDDTACRLRTGADSLDWLAIRIALLGLDFTVHEPPELIDHLNELALRIARAGVLDAAALGRIR